MTQVFSDSDAFARREIKIAVSEEGPVLAIDVVAHRLGWNFSLRQGPVSAIPAEKRKALRSESVLVAAAQFIAQYAYLDRTPNSVAIDIGKAIEVEIDREAEYQARLVDMAAHPERYAALKQLTPEELRVVQSANAVHYVTSVEVGEDADLEALKDAAVAAATALSLAVKASIAIPSDPPPPARVIANDGDTAETTTSPAPAPATEPADAPSDPQPTGAPTAEDNAEGLK